ncbi:uncharacterized protein UV8b_01025 [Ustilaginoidea virens]|uniref:Uncharacterized protein n=1 Tax=Ustilaginoidea virens TaxID=1159556 RepID=A0A8E5HKR6_USTVR|nr:uncharacterized protein UV8b_01025 [Ustilaginoidea virens]QUC16784.1 hypothetical protein UV8b_01025 [Ustilaginoidea virens]
MACLEDRGISNQHDSLTASASTTRAPTLHRLAGAGRLAPTNEHRSVLVLQMARARGVNICDLFPNLSMWWTCYAKLPADRARQTDRPRSVRISEFQFRISTIDSRPRAVTFAVSTMDRVIGYLRNDPIRPRAIDS